jgi:hypothetical protein
MSGDRGGGVVARLDGADLTAGVPGLARTGIELAIHDAVPVPSGQLTFAAFIDVVAAASAAVRAGAAGVVVTQGTDTLEETAYHQFGRRKRDGVPDGPSSHGAYSSHSEAVETILFTTQTSLDRARDKLDLKSMQLRDAQSSARVHKRKREDYSHKYEVQKKEIERLRRLLTSTRDRLEELEGSHSRLLERVQELEDEGDDLQGATAFVSDDDDYESEADVGEMYREMGDFVVEDDEDEDEEEEDPTEPDYDSAIDGSSTSS